MRRENDIISRVSKRSRKAVEARAERTNGFSLLELMISIALVAILAVITVPSFFTYRTKYQLKAAARDIYSTMQMAKVYAAKESAPWIIVFDAAGGTYQMCDDAGDNDWTTTADNTCRDAVDLSPYNVEFGRTGANKAPDDSNGSSVTYTSNIVGFNPTGSSFEGNGSLLTTPRYVYLRNDSGIVYAVGTTRAGIIRFYVWTGGGWK